MKQNICQSFHFNSVFFSFLQADLDTLVVEGELNKKDGFIEAPMVFKPIVDDFSKTPFIPEDPLDLIESGKFNQVKAKQK